MSKQLILEKAKVDSAQAKSKQQMIEESEGFPGKWHDTISMDKPKNFEGLMMPQSNQIHTGQVIMMFQTPESMVDRLNTLYEELVKEGKINKIHKNLVGKIESEYSIYFDDINSGWHPDDSRKNCNFIPDDIHEWIKDRIHQYLQTLRVNYMGIRTSSAWINDYKAKEYNPSHIHSGSSGFHTDPLQRKTWQIGLGTLMGLKIPEDMGKEITNDGEAPMRRNGCTEFISNSTTGQFTNGIITHRLQRNELFIFPYDMVHLCWPHFNEKETRRTCNLNVDVLL